MKRLCTRPELRRNVLALSFTVTILIAGSAAAALPPGNVVQQWNRVAEDTVIASGAFQNEGLLYMAYTSAAVYDALAAIDGTYRPLYHGIHVLDGASPEAAAIEAAYRTLRYYFPAQLANLDALYSEALAGLPATASTEAGRSVGDQAAAIIIAKRAHDGRLTPIGVTSQFDTLPEQPGVWRLTPPFAAPQTPWVGNVRPFVLHSVARFRPAPPPRLTSARWIREFNEIKGLGAATSTERTADETKVALFWTANVIRQYNRAGRDVSSAQSLSLMQTARVFAMINVVGADAQIALMHWKYSYLFWRPVTAIDPNAVTDDGFGPVPGFDDGNPNTIEQSGWRPLITTPNHPEYPSAHGSITSTIASVFAEILGTEQINLDLHGFDPAGAPGNLNAVRHFDTTAALRADVVNARLWGGLHYRGSTEAGVTLGRAIAGYDLTHAFKRQRNNEGDE